MCQPANKKQTSLRRVLRPGTFRALHVLALLLLISSFSSAAVTISNLAVAQRPGTKLVDITYSVSNPDTPSVIVTLAISNAGEPINATSLTGAIGTGVQTGAGKSIVWNMADDWDGNVAQLLYTLSAVPEMPEGGDAAATSWKLINSRFVKNFYSGGQVTMSDRTTGLMWLYDAYDFGSWQYYDSLRTCQDLVYANHGDWVLPSLSDITEIITQSSFFYNVHFSYWTSSMIDIHHRYVYYANGWSTYLIADTGYAAGVWPCRQQ